MIKLMASIPLDLPFTDGSMMAADAMIMSSMDPVPVLIGFLTGTLPIGAATFRRRGKFLDVKLRLVHNQPDNMQLTFSGKIPAKIDNSVTAFEIMSFNYSDLLGKE